MEGRCQIESGLVQRQAMDRGPEIQDIAMRGAAGVKTLAKGAIRGLQKARRRNPSRLLSRAVAK
jgi:hypothetical protein